MAFVAQYSLTVASLDQQVEASLLSPLFDILFLMILIKTLLELPLFYAGLLSMVVALTLRKRSATPRLTTRQNAILKIEHKAKKEVDRWTFVDSMAVFIFVGAAVVIFEILSAFPQAATDAYRTIEELSDPKYTEGDPLSVEQRAIVDRYSATYSKNQLLVLDQDERFVAIQIAKYKRDQRWLHVQSVLQHFAYTHAPKTSQNKLQNIFLYCGDVLKTK